MSSAESRPMVRTNLYDTDDSLTNVKFFATLGVRDSDDEALLSFVAANVMLPWRVDVGLPRYSSVLPDTPFQRCSRYTECVLVTILADSDGT